MLIAVLLVASLLYVLLTGCKDKVETDPVEDTLSVDSGDKPEISVFNLARTGSSKWVEVTYSVLDDVYAVSRTESFTVSDIEIINKLDAFRNDQEIRAPSEDEILDGAFSRWLTFDDGVIIGLYQFADYGYIGSEIEQVGNNVILPSGMSSYVEMLIIDNNPMDNSDDFITDIPLSPSREPLYFDSEEDFLSFVRTGDPETLLAYNLDTLTHYYKFNDFEYNILQIGPGTAGASIGITYDTQTSDDDGLPEHIMIQFSPIYDIDIENDGFWSFRMFEDESYILKHGNIDYYIFKSTTARDLDTPISLWSVEWIRDRLYMYSELPFRFSYEEVLELVCNLVKINI